MNPQDYMQRLAGLTSLSPVPQPPQGKPGYWWNDQRVPETKPFTERFAGGQNKAKFSPFQGDIARYGMGAQHRFYQADPETYVTTTTGTNTNTASSTTADPGTYQQQNGGPDGDQADRSAHRDGLPDRPLSELPGALMTGLSVLGGGLPAMATIGSHAALGKSPMAAVADFMGWGGRGSGMSPGDFVGGQSVGAAGSGMNVAGGVANPELAGRNDLSQDRGGVPGGWDGTDAGKEGAAVEAAAIDAVAGGAGPQALAEGGVVEGDQVQGQDDVTINADGGEGIIRAKPMTALGEPFLDALNTEDYALAYRLLGEIVQQSKRDATEDSIVARRRPPVASPPPQ